MKSFTSNYHQLVNEVIAYGAVRGTRNGSTRAIFGTMIQIDELRRGHFPILTTRKIFYRPVLGELAAFIRGAEKLSEFKALGCNYWDANATAWATNAGKLPKDMKVGKIYGAQWRKWGRTEKDQLAELIKNLRDDPFSRRHLLTTYNPEELYLACLPPCHVLSQFNVTTDGYLDCIVTMRSVDLMLGLPADVVLYASLLILISAHVNLKPGNLTFMLGDTHVYANHIKTWNDEQHGRPGHVEPTWLLSEFADILKFVPDDLELIDYQHGAKIDYAFNV